MKQQPQNKHTAISTRAQNCFSVCHTRTHQWVLLSISGGVAIGRRRGDGMGDAAPGGRVQGAAKGIF